MAVRWYATALHNPLAEDALQLREQSSENTVCRLPFQLVLHEELCDLLATPEDLFRHTLVESRLGMNGIKLTPAETPRPPRIFKGVQDSQDSRNGFIRPRIHQPHPQTDRAFSPASSRLTISPALNPHGPLGFSSARILRRRCRRQGSGAESKQLVEVWSVHPRHPCRPTADGRNGNPSADPMPKSQSGE